MKYVRVFLVVAVVVSGGCKDSAGFTGGAPGPQPITATQPLSGSGAGSGSAGPVSGGGVSMATVANPDMAAPPSASCAPCVQLLKQHATANGVTPDMTKAQMLKNTDGSCLLNAPNLGSDGSVGTVASCTCACLDYPVAADVGQVSNGSAP